MIGEAISLSSKTVAVVLTSRLRRDVGNFTAAAVAVPRKEFLDALWERNLDLVVGVVAHLLPRTKTIETRWDAEAISNRKEVELARHRDVLAS